MTGCQLSPRRRAVAEAMSTAPARGWHEVPGLAWRSVRWDRTVLTPAWALTDWSEFAGRSRTPLWTDLVFIQHVFVRLPGGVPLIRVCAAPWVGAHDFQVTLTRALDILTNPDALLDCHAAFEPVTAAEVLVSLSAESAACTPAGAKTVTVRQPAAALITAGGVS